MPRQPLPLGSWGNIARTEVTPGRWRAMARFRDYDGKTRQVEAWGTSGPKAVASLQAALTERAAPSASTITRDLRLSVLADLWLRELDNAGRLTQQTRDEYRAVTNGIVVPGIGGLRVVEATTSNLDRFLQGIAATRPARARQAKVVLRGMLGLAVRHDALSVNPIDGVGQIRRPARNVRALSVDELHALRASVRAWQQAGEHGPKRAPDLLDVVDVMLGTGARIGEVLALRWSDVDLGAARPTVTIAGTVVQVTGEGLRRQEHPKTRSGYRTIVLPRFVVETLMRVQLDAEPNPHDVIFPSARGTLRSPNNLRRQWRSARSEGGFGWVTPHVFRKTVATMVARERGTEDAAAQLGHAGTAVTEAHYVQRANIAPDVSDVLDKLGGR